MRRQPDYKPGFDDEPVRYCRDCHSLMVMVDESLAGEEWSGEYCGRCNSTNIAECSIQEWLAEEERRKKLREEIEWNK